MPLPIKFKSGVTQMLGITNDEKRIKQIQENIEKNKNENLNINKYIPLLLQNKTNGKNIIFATDSYNYPFTDEMTEEAVQYLLRLNKLRHRVRKSIELQKERTKKKAEVFTPSWVCKKMIDMCEPPTYWQEFIQSTWLEITCGEAPYITSLYDTTTGRTIPLDKRIGILDRKFQAINHLTDKDEWNHWAIMALKCTYGYEFQGDNLFIARFNVLKCYVDYYHAKWNEMPTKQMLEKVIDIITWNFWQMDGLTDTIPFTDIPSTIIDWKLTNSKYIEQIEFKDIKEINYVIGNPPYQETRGGTKNVNIWPEFIKKSIKIANISCFVHPGKWVIPKTNSKNLQKQILKNNLKVFQYFPNSNEVFNNVSIDGGISITLFDKNFNGIPHYIIDDEDKGEFNPTEKIFSSIFEEEAYHKVFKNITTNMKQYVHGGIGTLGYTDRFSFLDEESLATIKESNIGMIEPIKVWATITSGRGNAKYGWYYIEKTNIKHIADYQFLSRKVMLDKKGNSIAHGKGNVINNIPQICDKFVYGVNVLWVIPKNDTDRELELIKSLFMTKTARYLMCIKQKSLCVDGFENIPDYIELAKNLPEDELFTDKWFYKTFDFSKELINEIETRVSVKTEN